MITFSLLLFLYIYCIIPFVSLSILPLITWKMCKKNDKDPLAYRICCFVELSGLIGYNKLDKSMLISEVTFYNPNVTALERVQIRRGELYMVSKN